MSESVPLLSPPGVDGEPVPVASLDSESRFYGGYAWGLNAYPTVREVVDHLREEVRRLPALDDDWRRGEGLTNVFMLCCALADALDDYLLGVTYDFSKVSAVLPLAAPCVRVTHMALGALRKARERRQVRLRRWAESWRAAVHDFVKLLVAAEAPGRETLVRLGARLTALLDAGLPADLETRRPTAPAAFRTQDLTHFDVLALGRSFVSRFSDRGRPILVVGFRTAGSYFAPVLAAFLTAQGYQRLDFVTIRPKKGIDSWERAMLTRYAKAGGLAVLVDESPATAATLAKGVSEVRKVGFRASDVVALLPVHPTRREWTRSDDFLPLSEIVVLTLEPEHYYKYRLLEPSAVEARLREYFERQGYTGVRVVASPAAQRLNAELRQRSEEKFHTRLKRIYEVCLENEVSGQKQTRYVLAKSVGWGWLSYHAFLAGRGLSRFVPPVLGLRDGILYTEWLHRDSSAPASWERGPLIDRLASYVSARVRLLGLGSDPAPDLSQGGRHNGFASLANTLTRAYGPRAAALKRARIEHEVSRRPTPFPTLIDGRIRPLEWVGTGSALLKSDFEHHGLGKTELNMTDPAYDLAEAILHFGLAPSEERALITRYVEQCGDTGVEERLFLAKLLAGTWAMGSATASLADGRLLHRHQEFNEQYINAWNFLTAQTTRFCGRLCGPAPAPRWRSPLVVMDIDGVLDKQIFGFPSTTAAGIRAVALLHAHDVAVAVDTARMLSEVKEYCTAYGFVGGVAEYGSVVWDAVSGRERVLVTGASLEQLKRVRSALRQIPGVFLNDGYQYSIRAYTYERGVTVAVPTVLIRNLIAALEADRLSVRQTYLDTAVVAKEVDKGRGLLALLALVGQEDLDTIAIGDSEPDLPMFRVAKRSFAPAQIACGSVARLLGCQIVDRAYQPGLLRAVQSIVHSRGGERCRLCDQRGPEAGGLVWQLLKAADAGRLRSLLRAALDPMALQVFVR